MSNRNIVQCRNSRQPVDALVIGSGFGGSITAAHLTEAGVKVALIERGPWRDTQPVRTLGIEERAQLPQGAAFWRTLVRSVGSPRCGHRTLNARGLLDIYFGRGITIGCSSGVGGGSHVYTALHHRPQRTDYWDTLCEGLSEQSMAPHQAAFLRRMGSLPLQAFPHLPTDSGSLNHNLCPEILTDTAPAFQYLWGVLPPLAESSKDENETAAMFGRSRSTYRNDGILGSPGGAKTTLDIAYIAPAIKLGLQVYDLCEALYIGKLGGCQPRRYLVYVLDHRTGTVRTIGADSVFLAAGTLNTLRLLFKSRDRYGGLGGMPVLGQGFHGNGDSMAWWHRNQPNADYQRGLPAYGGLTERGSSGEIQVIQVGLLGFETLPLPGFIKSLLRKNVMLVAMGQDRVGGKAHLRRDLLIHYDAAANPILAQTQALFERMSAASRKRIWPLPLCATVHPLGGARVGRDNQQSVISVRGQVHEHPGLYVCDASAFPTALGAPPSLSIAAWASHVSAEFIRTPN